jgi:hypothetical protein
MNYLARSVPSEANHADSSVHIVWSWTFGHFEVNTSHWTDNVIILAYHLLILKILIQVKTFFNVELDT